ncbi:unnamed protein product, partial [Adineta steineri]
MSGSESENIIKESNRPRTGFEKQIFFFSSKFFFHHILEPKLNKWKQNAITVAGGNEQGQELNQLNGPAGIFIDKNKNIFIADYANDRIVEWKYNSTEGKIIAGENKEENQIDALYGPTDVIVDEQNHS